jgi:hypothetical protein
MVELTKEQREAVKREHDALVDYLEAGGYDVDQIFDIFADEIDEYVTDNGYGYCKWCDERRGDGDRGF